MNNIEKYTGELKKLDKKELIFIFYNLLKNGSISFNQLSEVYVHYLEGKDEDNRDLIAELGFSLIMYKDGVTGDTWEQAEEKANKAIIRTNLFSGTEYEAKLLKTLS